MTSVLAPPSFPPVLWESGGQRIARITRFYVGCSLYQRFNDLAALVGRGVDDVSVATWTSNCCMFALGVLSAAGLTYPPLQAPSKNGQAFVLLEALGNFFNAWRTPAVSEVIPVGALLWYRTEGKDDDHVEVMLTPPDEHGGAGRRDNGVSLVRSDVHTSEGRPLYRWLDPDALNLPDANVETADAQESPTRPSLIPAPLHRRVPLPFDPDSDTIPAPPNSEKKT